MNEPADVDDPGDRSVEPGVWRYARAERVAVIIDAEDYFAMMQQAMLNARDRIMLIGWDFDTRIHLAHGRRWYHRPFNAGYPSRLGSFLLWLARNRPDLDIRILKWGLSIFQFTTRGAMLLDVARMWPREQIDFHFDTRHPVGCSHHQKVAVLDNKLSVCGGIDMTARRWDTREHREQDQMRTGPGGKIYEPWHDITMMMEGEVGQVLAELGHSRWVHAGGKPMEAIEPPQESLWPEQLWVDFEDVEIGIARTRAEYDGIPKVDEIEILTRRLIREARRFIYIENQYLTSRVISEALAERLKEADPPEIVIVHPQNADGWLEQQAMDHARAEIAAALREIDHKDRFRLYVPFSGETPIYVHAKLMVVDDRVLKIGSANLNNRSMGLDSECDAFIDADRPGNASAGEGITRIRTSLIAEHCGFDEAEMARHLESAGSMIAAIDRWGRTNSRQLREFEIPELGEIEAKLAETQALDPESPDEMFEPFASSRLFRKGTVLERTRARLRRRKLRRKLKHEQSGGT